MRAHTHTHKTLWLTKVFVVVAATRISRQGGKWRGGGEGHWSHVGSWSPTHTILGERTRREDFGSTKNDHHRFTEETTRVAQISMTSHIGMWNASAIYFFFPLNSFMSIQFSHGFKLFFIWSQSFLITLQFNHEFHPICS